MKKNKHLIIFLLSIFAYVLYVPDYNEKIENLQERIKYLNFKINKEKYINENKEEILKEIENYLKISKENEKFLFEDKNISEIQSTVQDYLKSSALSSEVKFLGAAWDEPLIYEEYKYDEIPITSSVKGTPPAVALFFNKIFKFDKLLQLKSLEINRTRPYSLLFAFKVSTYKIKGEKEEAKK